MRIQWRRWSRFALLAVVMQPFATLLGQDIYFLPKELQEFGIKNHIYEELGADKNIALYINTVTAIDVIGRARAKTLNRPLEIEDYEASAWSLCVLPWTPPKKEEDKAKLKAIRGKLVADVFISQEARNRLIMRINLDLLKQSPKELIEKKISPVAIVRFKEEE